MLAFMYRWVYTIHMCVYTYIYVYVHMGIHVWVRVYVCYVWRPEIDL